MTNTQKRQRERQLLREINPVVRQQVIQDKQGPIYNADGEDISDKYEIIVKTSDSQVRALKAKDAMNAHSIENGKYIHVFFEKSRLLQERFPSLTPQDIARLLFIGTYTQWETGRLQTDDGKKLLKKPDVRELIGLSPKRFNQLYNRYKDEEILLEGEGGALYISATVIYRGKISKLGNLIDGFDYTRVFKKTVRELYAQFNGRKLGQLAIVYSIIPFLNFNSNLICFNPEETVTDEVTPMNISELADLLGYENKAKFKTTLNGIKVGDDPMFTFIEDPYNRREKRIIVNPRIVFAGNGEALEQVKTYFN